MVRVAKLDLNLVKMNLDKFKPLSMKFQQRKVGCEMQVGKVRRSFKQLSRRNSFFNEVDLFVQALGLHRLGI